MFGSDAGRQTDLSALSSSSSSSLFLFLELLHQFLQFPSLYIDVHFELFRCFVSCWRQAPPCLGLDPAHIDGGAFAPGNCSSSLKASLSLQSPFRPPVVRRNLVCPFCLWLNSTTPTISRPILPLQLVSLSWPSKYSILLRFCKWISFGGALRLLHRAWTKAAEVL